MAYRQAEAAAILDIPVHQLYRSVRDGRQDHVRISPATAVIPHACLAAALGVANPEDQGPAVLREAGTVPAPVAAELLGVALYSVERGIAKGWIPTVRMGNFDEVPAQWLELLRTGATKASRAPAARHSQAAAPEGTALEQRDTPQGATTSATEPSAPGKPTRRRARPAPLSSDRCAYGLGEAARALRVKPKSLVAACRAGEVPAAELRPGFFVVAHHWLARELKCPDSIYEPCSALYWRSAFGREHVRKLLGVGRDTVARAIEEERLPFDDTSGDPIIPFWWLDRLRTGREPRQATLRLWRGDAVRGWREADGMLTEPLFVEEAEGVTVADIPMRRPAQDEPAGARTRDEPGDDPALSAKAAAVVDLGLLRALRRRGGANAQR